MLNVSVNLCKRLQQPKICIIKKIVIICIAFSFLVTNAQIDSTKVNAKKTFLQKSIVPLSLIGIGTFINYSKGGFGKEQLQNKTQKGLNFDSNLDNILLFAPAIEMYSANLFHIKSENTLRNQTKYLIVSSLATFGTVQLLKRTFKEERPDKSDKNSLPSGHTAIAFSMATVLYHEYRNSHKFLAYSGYAFATTTAAFRVLNNKHFTSDVFVGAGIGILITELSYNFKPLKNWQPFKSKKRQVFIVPMYQNDGIGFTSIIRF